MTVLQPWVVTSDRDLVWFDQQWIKTAWIWWNIHS